MTRFLVAIVAVYLASACSGSGPRDDPGGRDAAPPDPSRDAGPGLEDRDAGTPDAGRGDAGPPACDCEDDGDPCTLEVCADDGACTHPPAAEGTTCGPVPALCQEAPRCDAAGACVPGARRNDPPTVEASAYGYGTTELARVAAFLREDRLVFAERVGSGSRLTVVDFADGGALEVVAQTHTDLEVHFHPVSGWVWGNRPSTHVLPLGPDRFALIQGTIDKRLAVFRVVGTELVEESRAPLPTFGYIENFWDVVRLGGTPDGGDLLAVCGVTPRRIALGPDGTITEVDVFNHEGSPIGTCRRLALEEDSSRLWVTGRNDAFVIDDPAGDAPMTRHLMTDVFIWDLDLGAPGDGAIALRRNIIVGPGIIEVRSTDDFSLLATPAASIGGTGVYASGAIVDGAFVGTHVINYGDPRLQEIRIDRFDDGAGASPAPSSSLAIRRYRSESRTRTPGTDRTADRGRRFTGPQGRVFELMDDGGIREWTGPGHGNLEALVAGEAGVFAVGPEILHRVASDGSRFVEGGRREDGVDLEALQLPVGSEPPVGVTYAPRFIQQSVPDEPVSWLSFDAEGPAAVEPGILSSAEGWGLQVGSRALVSESAYGSREVTVHVACRESEDAGCGETWSFTMPEPPNPAVTPFVPFVHFDPATGTVLASQYWRENDGVAVVVARWVPGDDAEIIEQVWRTDVRSSVGVLNGYVLLRDLDWTLHIERIAAGGIGLEPVAQVPVDDELGRIQEALLIDGSILYGGSVNRRPSGAVAWELVAVDLETGALVGRYALPSLPTSMTVAPDGTLWAGTSLSVHRLTPVCDGDHPVPPSTPWMDPARFGGSATSRR